MELREHLEQVHRPGPDGENEWYSPSALMPGNLGETSLGRHLGAHQVPQLTQGTGLALPPPKSIAQGAATPDLLATAPSFEGVTGATSKTTHQRPWSPYAPERWPEWHRRPWMRTTPPGCGPCPKDTSASARRLTAGSTPFH
jgi:hypothetical protein